MVVDFTGRKSGRPYSLVLTAHLIDGILYALTGATWKANFRDGAPAQVLHDGRSTAMRGELITDTALVADLYARCAESYGVKKRRTGDGDRLPRPSHADPRPVRRGGRGAGPAGDSFHSCTMR